MSTTVCYVNGSTEGEGRSDYLIVAKGSHLVSRRFDGAEAAEPSARGVHALATART